MLKKSSSVVDHMEEALEWAGLYILKMEERGTDKNRKLNCIVSEEKFIDNMDTRDRRIHELDMGCHCNQYDGELGLCVMLKCK